jgi:CIC family chloride channel protein
MTSPDTSIEPVAPPPPAGALGHLRTLVRSSDLALTLIAALIGGASGVVVLLMGRTVQWTHVLLFGIDLNERLSGAVRLQPVALLVWPTLGGLLVGLSLWLAGKLGRPPAVDPIEANALHGGRLPISDSLIVAVQTLLSSGFGASVGLEAGYTQAGAGLASAVGVRLKLRRSDLRVLVGAGAAGAIAAAFGAPLTGAFYGFEVVIGAYAIANVAPVMAAAIAGALVSQQIGGSLYHIEAHSAGAIRNLDYLLFAALGVVCAGLAIVWMRSVSTLERAFQLPFLPSPLRPALGGLIVGGLALISSHALSAGHGALQFDLSSAQSVRVVLMLLAVKMLASAVSLGSGFRGGLFFASLLVGALTGLAFAQVLALTGWVQLEPTSAALVGMGAFAVGIVGGPLTMSFLVLETTGDYALTGAVLAASIVASLIVRETFGYSFSTFRLHLRGESIRSANDIGWIRSLTVGRLMRRDPPALAAATSLKELRRRFPLGAAQWIVLLDDQDRYAGMARLADAFAPGVDETRPASDLAKLADGFLLPAMNIKQAMALFDRVEAEALAVLDGAESRRVLGLLTETFAVRRYAEELDKSHRELIGEPALESDQA